MKKAFISLAAFTSVLAATSMTVSAEEVIVKRGDTLWSIAQNNGVSVDYIKEMNQLSSNLIFPNQSLTISEENKTYTVQSGDTLWGISQANGMTVDALMTANGLTSDLIHPGQVLSLTVGAAATAAAQPSVQESTEVEPEPQTNEQATAETNTSQPAASADQDDVVKTLTMEATAYTAFCEGCSGVTYTGIDLRANPDRKVIAVDPDVIPLGTEVYVEGYGRAVAGDIGGAIDGNRIDVFIADRSEALEFGRQTVEVKILE